MKTLTNVYWWHARICPSIGLIFNFMLIFLVINKTHKEMLIHSRILLQNGILDIIILSLTIFGQPAVSSHSNVKIILFEGFLSIMFENDSNLISIFSFAIFSLTFCDIFGVAPQFIYRYLVLNRNIKINLLKYLGMLSLILLPLCIYLMRNNGLTMIEAKQMPFNESGILYNEDFMRTYFLEVNGTTKYFVRNTKGMEIGSNTNLFLIGFYMYSLVSYLTIAFCGWKISRFVNSNLTGKKKELSKQLNMNLIILAILPVIQLVTTTIMLSLPAINGIVNKEEEMIEIKTKQIYSSLTKHWMPVLNPLISIVTNMPYRRALLQIIKRKIVPANQITLAARPAATIATNYHIQYKQSFRNLP